MIQRIQSLYLFVVVILFVTMLMTPLVDFAKDGIQYVLNYEGIVPLNGGEAIVGTYFLTALEVIIPLVSLVAMLLYKNRIIQIRLVAFNIVLMIGYYALFGVYLYVAKTSAKLDFFLHLPVLFPLITAILSYLALRAIGRDEALVRSLNHLR